MMHLLHRRHGVLASLIGMGFAAGFGVPLLYAQGLDDVTKYPILAPCTRFDDRYEDLGFTEDDAYLLTWPDKYHEQVDTVVEEYFEKTPVNCQAEDYQELFEPGEELRSLAENLPPWQDSKTSEQLSRLDTGRVLLEYLRFYECALMEYQHFSYIRTAEERFQQGEYDDDDEDEPVTDDFFDFFFSDLTREMAERTKVIEQELYVARTAMDRLLNIIGAIDRLRPIEAELECTQRMSIDLRNLAALTAETAACMPRMWNASDPLRDIQE